MGTMPKLEKSDLIKNVLGTLISISGRKTTQGYAILTMDSLIKKLESRFDFLAHVQIIDNRFLEGEEAVSVMTNINAIDPSELGKAIHAIIYNVNKSLGDNAGHFFIKEIQNNLGESYNLMMRNMGVDLGLMQLQDEVEKLGRTTLKRR